MDKPKYYNEARNRASQRYQAAHMVQIRVWTYKRDRIKDRVKIAADAVGLSSAEYMRGAILARLDADGVGLDDLPPEDVEDAP